MEQPIQERTMSSETEGLPERDSSLKYMYFPKKSNQIIYQCTTGF